MERTGHLVLSNGHINILTPAKFLECSWHNRLRIAKKNTTVISDSCGFFFTNPTGSRYFELLKQFVNPTTLSLAKAAVGINTTHWNSFTQAAIAFGLLEKIPKTRTYQLTANGQLYIAEVEAGRDKFTYSFAKDFSKKI